MALTSYRKWPILRTITVQNTNCIDILSFPIYTVQLIYSLSFVCPDRSLSVSVVPIILLPILLMIVL